MGPVCFHGCVGWLHEPPSNAASGRAIIVAPPHGFEELCARRTLRMLADRLAAAGMPTLRFDWRGTADSLGDPCDPGRLTCWRADLDAAIDMLRMRGAREIGVIGLRFGALLAAELGTRGVPVDRVAMLAPPPSGRGYVREMRALSRVTAPTAASPEPPFDGLVVAGLRTSAQTLDEMRAWCFSDQTAPPAPDVLIAAPDGALGAQIASRRMKTLGARVARVDFPGYDRMMCDPTASEAALDALDPLVAWAVEDAPGAGHAPSVAQAAYVAALAEARSNVAQDFAEEPLRFGPQGAYCGVLCRPRAQEVGAPVIFLNAGGSHHAGWARSVVEQARRLAAAGLASLRIDLPGVGDSLGFEDRTRPAYYAESQIDAVRAAIDLLERRGYPQVRVIGACSGAHHAFHAARLDRRITAAMIVNLQIFVWTPRCALAFGAWMNSRAFDVGMRTRVEDAETTRLARLQARLAASAVALAKTSAKSALRALRNAASIQHADHDEDGAIAMTRGALAEMSGRGVKIAFVYGEDDSGLAEFRSVFGEDGARATSLAHVTLDFIPYTDHPITPTAARARLSALLEDWCGLAPARGAEPMRQAKAG